MHSKRIEHGVDYRVPKTGTVLSVGSDAKTSKSLGFGYLQGVIYLVPHVLARTFVASAGGRSNIVPTLCEASTAACRAACLLRAGRGAMDSVARARMNRTLRYLNDPAGFLASLEKDIRKLQRKAAKLGVTALVRPSGTQGFAPLRRDVFELCSRLGVQAFDYSEAIGEARKYLGSETPVTFSHKGETTLADSVAFLRDGGNVSVVFDVTRGGELPKRWQGFPVVDGDAHDVRLPEADGRGVVVGLRLKRTVGDRAARRQGFAQLGRA